MLLQKLAIAENVGEPFGRARKCSSDDGSIPDMQSCVKEANSISRANKGDQGNSP